MDNYFEQNVAGRRGPAEQMLYAACWGGVVVLALVAMFNAANILSFSGDNLGISWINVAVTVVGAALAVLVYRAKDSVYREFDYTLWNGEFEVSAVFNRRRRKKIATIQLSKVVAWGPAEAMARHMHGLRAQNWCVHRDAAWCMVYTAESGKQAALLEPNEEMLGQLRAVSSAMRMAEVKP